jgi:hypothetical protein
MTINIYADTQVGLLDTTGLPLTRGGTNTDGQPLLRKFKSYKVPTTTSAGDIWRIFKNLDANIIPVYLTIGTYNALTSLAVSAGIYAANQSTTVKPVTTGAAILMAATSIATAALPMIGLGINGLAALQAAGAWQMQTSGDSLGQQQMLYQIAGDSLVSSGSAAPNTGTPRQYDLCLTVTTATSVAGFVGVELLYTQG